MTDTMNFADLSGKTVYDRDGEKIGEVSQMWLDDVTGKPDWLTIRTGLFGMNESFLPYNGLRDGKEGDLHTSYTKQQVKDAPNVHPEAGHLDQGEENRLYRHYGITPQQRQSPEGKHRQGLADQGTGRGQAPVAMAPTPDTIAQQRSAGHDRATQGMDRAAQGRDAGRAAMEREGTRDPRRGEGRDDAITRSEERLRIGYEETEAGRVRLRKYVVTETEQVQVPVRKERVRIEREPINESNIDRAVAGPEISEAEHEITLHEQRPVVTTETIPVERIRLAREEYTETQTLSGEVRKERVEVDGDVEDAARPRDPREGKKR